MVGVVVAGAAGSLMGIENLGRFQYRLGESVAYGTFTPPTIETENILLIAGVVFTAIAAIWFVKKGIKLLNRS